VNPLPRGRQPPPATDDAAPASIPRPGPVELDEAECRRLLATATIGRISFTDGALPAIVPVPFALHEGQVFIPAEPSSRMVAAVRGAVVAFGVDSFDPRTETGWSVTVVGPSRVVGDQHRLEVLRGAGLSGRWTAPDRRLITVQVGLLRGWRARERDQDAATTRSGLPHLEGSCNARTPEEVPRDESERHGRAPGPA
jgi:uncharacterized protein